MKTVKGTTSINIETDAEQQLGKSFTVKQDAEYDITSVKRHSGLRIQSRSSRLSLW